MTQVSFDETLLAHEQIWSQYRGLHTGEKYTYSRGDIRNQQAVVAMAHLIERAFAQDELQAAADAEMPSAPNVLGAMRMGAHPQ